MDEDIFTQGYEEALKLLKRTVTADGFVASITERHNYNRVWSRDGVIIGLAGLMTDEEDLHKAMLATLRTLMNHQGPHGEIPSNVDASLGEVSYGGTAGRVDASLWFLIGCHRYWQKTRDERFLEEFHPSMQKVVFLLGAWEFNNKGFIYVPESGDWADEYVQHGYVLYDQLLYWRALWGMCEINKTVQGYDDHVMEQKAGRIFKLIRGNYWFFDCDPNKTVAYHPVIYQKGCQIAETKGAYWMSYFSPTGYGYRFDAFANSLASLLGVAEADQHKKVNEYIDEKVVNGNMKLLPAFSPVIENVDRDWEKLQIGFSFDFRNQPYEYHNGGLWAMVNGFYVAALAKWGDKERAREYLKTIHEVNKMDLEGKDWGFYEYINGKTFKPGGTRLQGWSASGAVMAHLALEKGVMPI